MKLYDKELFLWYVDRRIAFSLISSGTIVRDPQHRESPTRGEQDLNLRRNCVQALLNEVVNLYNLKNVKNTYVRVLS